MDQSLILAETPTEKFPDREFPPTNEKETQEIKEIVEEETVTKPAQKSVPDFPEGVQEDDLYMSEDIYETREETTYQIYSNFEEEISVFIIKSVVDPRTNTLISKQEAVLHGILDQVKGTYVNPLTKEVMELIDAENKGFVIMQMQSRKTISKEDQSYVYL